MYACNMVVQHTGNVLRAGLVKLEKVFDHYGIAGPNDVKGTKAEKEKWLASMPTHVDRLQLFHLLIDTIPDTKNSREFQEDVGNFLFSAGDLSGMKARRLRRSGTKREWKEEVREVLDSTRIDSDIASEIISVPDDTSWYDSDDIASDIG
jgi:hypothetical protein